MLLTLKICHKIVFLANLCQIQAAGREKLKLYVHTPIIICAYVAVHAINWKLYGIRSVWM
jgi:hypothetical protein